MNFWDKLGRLHTKPVTEDNPYPTNNAYIYTAYYKLLYPDNFIQHGPCYLPLSFPFSRHPEVIGPAISHDEITGVCILSGEKAKMICEYLKENHNQFCDLPGFKSKSFLLLNWFKVYKAFKLLGKEEKTRTAVVKYPDMWNLAFWQRPEHMWFYKRCASITPNLIERIYFTLARSISIMRWKKEEPNLLLFFSLLHLELEKNLGIEGKFIQWFMKKKIHNMYIDSISLMLFFAQKDLDHKFFTYHPWITGK